MGILEKRGMTPLPTMQCLGASLLQTSNFNFKVIAVFVTKILRITNNTLLKI